MANLAYSIFTLPSFRPEWLEARGQNSYCYYAIYSLGTQSQRVATNKTITVDAGAPFLCAVLIKNNYSVDFPTGAMLTITGPDGTVYNRDSDGKMPLAFDSGSSLRGLLVKNPLPGDWIVSLTVPVGVEFDFEFETLPSQDVDDTIENTLKPIYLKPSESRQLQKRQLAKSGGGDDFFELFLRMMAAHILAALWEMASNSAPSERQQATSSTSQAVTYATSSRLDIFSTPTPTSLPEATETIAASMEERELEGEFNLLMLERPNAPYAALDRYNTALTEHQPLIDNNHPVEVARHHIIPDTRLRDFWNRMLETGDINEAANGLLTAIDNNINQYRINLTEDDRQQVISLLRGISSRQIRHNPERGRPPGFDNLVAVYEWLPGNLFIGPRSGGGNYQRTDDPEDDFESNAGVIVNNASYFANLQAANSAIERYLIGQTRTPATAVENLSKIAKRNSPFDINQAHWLFKSKKYRIKKPD